MTLVASSAQPHQQHVYSPSILFHGLNISRNRSTAIKARVQFPAFIDYYGSVLIFGFHKYENGGDRQVFFDGSVVVDTRTDTVQFVYGRYIVNTSK